MYLFSANEGAVIQSVPWGQRLAYWLIIRVHRLTTHALLPFKTP